MLLTEFPDSFSLSVYMVTIQRFYRLRSKTNSSLRPTIIRSKIIASTLLMSTIFKPTQISQYKNCFYSINVYNNCFYSIIDNKKRFYKNKVYRNIT